MLIIITFPRQIRGHEEISSAPPSSPDPEEREEAELAASSSDTEGLKGNSGSFSSVTRFSLVPSPENLSTSDTDVLRGFSGSFTYGARFLPPLPLKDLSASDPALPTYSNDRWYKTKNTSEEEGALKLLFHCQKSYYNFTLSSEEKRKSNQKD